MEPSMRNLVMTLAIAAAMAGCGAAQSGPVGATGPVDHSCHSNPQDSQGSGCEHQLLRRGLRANLAMPAGNDRHSRAE